MYQPISVYCNYICLSKIVSIVPEGDLFSVSTYPHRNMFTYIQYMKYSQVDFGILAVPVLAKITDKCTS